MAASQQVAYGSASVVDNLTRHISAVGTLTIQTAVNEAFIEVPIRDAGVIDKAYVRVGANTITATTTLTLRQNLADTSLVVTVGSDQTGGFEDITNSVSVAATDEVDWKIVTGTEAGTNTIIVTILSYKFTPTASGDTVIQAYNGGGANLSTDSVTRFMAPTGSFAFSTTEANCEARMRAAFTSRRLAVYVTANARLTDTVFRTRIDNGNGAQLVTFSTLQTGLVEDASNSDALVAGNDFGYSVDTGLGTAETLTCQYVTSSIVSANRQWPFFLGNSAGFAPSLAADHFPGVAGDLAIDNPSTNTVALFVPTFDITVRELAASITANTLSAGINLRVQDNNASGTLDIAISAGAGAQVVTDTTNSDAIAAGESVNLMMDMAGGTGAITFRQITLIGETAAPGGRTTKNTRAWPLGTEIGMNWRGAA